jgi:hypothetical protein
MERLRTSAPMSVIVPIACSISDVRQVYGTGMVSVLRGKVRGRTVP